MRFNALPNASYIGFTGTPIIQGEQELTKNIFGEYVSIYDFKSSIEDGATLPLMYVNKGEKLHIENPNLDNDLIDMIDHEDIDEEQRLKVVVLDEDVAKVFKTSESVNKVLRALIES